MIEPLFLDGLRAEFERLKARKDSRRRTELQRFHRRLGAQTFLDPACGCGNFLIIAYRELRALEIEVLKEIHSDVLGRLKVGVAVLPSNQLSIVDVDQFYGIEIGEFPARIAETALWMMDHIMNNRLSAAFGQAFARIPLKKSPHILHADALEVDWAALLPPEQCSYVLGNPPFIGAKYQTAEQRAQVRGIANLGGSGGTLDYVCAWFLKAGAYVQAGGAPIGFVATNSVTQGEQVAQLWPLLFDRYRLEIAFAHRTFAWGSDARGMAHVHVVIIGLAKAEAAPAERRLFGYADIKGDPAETRHKAIAPYLFDAGSVADPHLVVKEESRPINGLPKLKTGVQMIDNGIYTFKDDEKAEFLQIEPLAIKFFRKYIGGDEYINGFYRWILYLPDANPQELRKLPNVMDRINSVREYRSKSGRASTQKMSLYPTKLGVDERLERGYLVLPNTSSERREYVPIGWLGPDVIANQKLRILADALPWHFALLTSAMHMAWMRAITGRMKSDYMYSVGVVYNTFPLPPVRAEEMERVLTPHAEAVLAARANHAEATLADLYDPLTMPPDLRRAHTALDRAVDRLYRPKGFASERERVEHLFMLYEKLQAPLAAKAAAKPKRRRKRPPAKAEAGEP